MASLEVSASIVRNRITVLGFVLTLDVFAANMLAREHYPQGVYWVFLSAFVAWALSMIWAVIAIAVLLLAADYRLPPAPPASMALGAD